MAVEKDEGVWAGAEGAGGSGASNERVKDKAGGQGDGADEDRGADLAQHAGLNARERAGAVADRAFYGTAEEAVDLEDEQGFARETEKSQGDVDQVHGGNLSIGARWRGMREKYRKRVVRWDVGEKL